MKKEDLVIIKIKRNSLPRPVVIINIMLAKQLARRVFGFERSSPDKFFKSPDLDEVKVSVHLAKLEADMNWIKRLMWVLICGSAAGFYFD